MRLFYFSISSTMRAVVIAIIFICGAQAIAQTSLSSQPPLDVPQSLSITKCGGKVSLWCGSGTASLFIRNVGTTTRTIDYVKTNTGPNDPFSGESSAFTLRPNETKAIKIKFSPRNTDDDIIYQGETTIVSGSEVVKVKLQGHIWTIWGSGNVEAKEEEPSQSLDVNYYPNHPSLSSENTEITYTVREAGNVFISLLNVVTGKTTVVVNEKADLGLHIQQIPNIQKGTYILSSQFNGGPTKRIRVLK